MSSKSISDQLIAKSLAELSAPKQPQQRSRVWTSPVGYRYLVQWSNSVLLRHFIRLFTDSHIAREYKRKAQLDDAGRSTVRNLEEGFKRATTSEYLDFVGFSQGSLEEVKGDVRDLTDDGLLPSVRGSNLAGIGIDLGDFNRALRPRPQDYRKLEEGKEIEETRGSYRSLKETNKRGKQPPESDQSFAYRPLSILYPPLSKVRAEDLTYEIFMELINKTDYLLRKLVESLEKKLASDQKAYQIDRARIRDKFRKK